MKSKTHWETTLRPPPGTRFTIFGSDCVLEFPRGKEEEIFAWLTDWLNVHVKHDLRMSAYKPPPSEDPQITEVKKIISDGNQNITTSRNVAPAPAEGNPPTPTEGTSPNADMPGTWATTTKINE